MSVNEDLLSEAIRHAIALQQFSTGSVHKIIALLNRAGAHVEKELLQALSLMTFESFNVDRLETLLTSVRAMNRAAYQKLAEQLSSDMRDLSSYELDHQYDLFSHVIPAQVLIELPLARVNAEQVYAATMARPFQGRLLREWAASQEAGSMQRIRDTVRSGYVEQQTLQQIVQRVRGTRANKYEDGVLAISRREAEAVVRTALSHTAGYARDSFLADNEQLVKAQQWVSVLDTRTSEPCILRDGKQFSNDATHTPIGHSYPWGAGPGRFHWNCRSTSIPVVKSFRELGFNIDELPPGTRASLDGYVAEDTTFADWIKKQSAARQDDALGPMRGKLLRDGGLTVDKFANNKGVWYTIDELRKQDAAAFRKAGI